MKTLPILAIFIFSTSFLAFSCGSKHDHAHGDSGEHIESTEGHTHTGNDGETAESHDGHVHGEGKEFTSKYVCPMHCEGSGSEDPGTCPVCGMDYVLLEEHLKDGHSHE